MVHPTITIRAKHGQAITVDKWQAWKVLGRKWRINPQGYATTGIYDPGTQRNHTKQMQCILAEAGPGKEIDHINRNPLDNRLSNLRSVSHSANNQNGKLRDGRKYRGTTREGNRWRAQIMCRYVRHYLGMHLTEEDAACAYDAAARRLFPGTAALNFPP